MQELDKNHVGLDFIRAFVQKTSVHDLLRLDLDKMNLDEESYLNYQEQIAIKEAVIHDTPCQFNITSEEYQFYSIQPVPLETTITGRMEPPFTKEQAAKFTKMALKPKALQGPSSRREELLYQGIGLTSTDRNETHGDFKSCMRVYAKYLSVYFTEVLGIPVTLEGSHASMVHCLGKITRTEMGQYNEDDARDGAVYLAGWAECREDEES